MDNLTVIIPFWNGHYSIESLLDSVPDSLPVLVIDDLSDVAYASDRANVTVYRMSEKGYFTGAVNYGASLCDTDFLILNQDVRFSGTQWLDLIAEKRSQYATIGEKIKGVHPAWPRGYIHGTFMFIRRDAWSKAGEMNVRDYPLWGSTCEWQLRACRKDFKALPLETIPGMIHERKEKKYGSAIAEMLTRVPHQQNLLIRTPPAISVVVNCYNHGRYLEDLVNSLIGGPTSLGEWPGQTFQSFELIIVNDGSTDDTAEICNQLADPWKGIRCIHQQNQGSAVACNTAISKSFGKYIAPLDADDMMMPERLEKMYRKQIKNPHSVIFDNLLTFNGTGIEKLASGKNKVWPMPNYNFDQIVWKNSMHKGLMYPVEAWKEVGGYPAIMNKGREDWAINVGLGRLGWCGEKIDYAGYLYRRDGQNRTLTNTTPTWRDHFLSQLKSLYPDVYAGRYPKMCCGNKNNAGAAARRGTSRTGGNLMAVGEQGMLKLKYNGLNSGTMSFWGNATNTQYVFGGTRPEGYVDSRDADGLLDMWEGGRQMFEIIPEPKAEKQLATEYVPEPEPTVVMPEPVVVTPDPVEFVPEPVVDSGLDPSKLSVSKLKEQLEGLSKGELETLLEAEKTGNARKTAIAAIEEQLLTYA